MPSPGAHIRGGGISGDRDKLNEKAIKIISFIRTAPHAVTIAKIIENTGIPGPEVEKNLILLGQYKMIYVMKDEEGMKVYTNPEARPLIDSMIGNDIKQALAKIVNDVKHFRPKDITFNEIQTDEGRKEVVISFENYDRRSQNKEVYLTIFKTFCKQRSWWYDVAVSVKEGDGPGQSGMLYFIIKYAGD